MKNPPRRIPGHCFYCGRPIDRRSVTCADHARLWRIEGNQWSGLRS